MWTNQRTQQGDTLVSLARAYNVSVEKMLAANSIRTPKEHTDSYLSKRAQECMIPSNTPRKVMSKLILEHDIQRWVHNVGGECIPLRAGSKAEMTRLMACVPGEFCHFSDESIINLPQKKRLGEFAGLGALSVIDLVNQANALKVEAKKAADKIVASASFMADDEVVQDWRTNFLFQVDRLLANASKPDAQGIPLFVRKPNLLKLIADYIADAKNQTTGFVEGGLFDNATTTLRTTIANVLSAAAAFVVPTTVTPPSTKTPAPSKKDTSALAAVRAGATTLKKGAKGAAVTELQTMLHQVGLTVGIDADFGNKTKGGVEDFQRFRNLSVNGVLDAATLRDLDAVVAAGGKATLGKKASGGAARTAKATVATVPVVVEPAATPVVQTRSSNTMLYAAVGLGVLLVAGAALARR